MAAAKHPLDLTGYTVGATLTGEPVEILSRLLNVDANSVQFTRGMLYNLELRRNVEYVLVQDKATKKWDTHKLDDLKAQLLKEEIDHVS